MNSGSPSPCALRLGCVAVQDYIAAAVAGSDR